MLDILLVFGMMMAMMIPLALLIWFVVWIVKRGND